MKTPYRKLLVVPLLLASCLAQAAHFELIEGSVTGDTRFEALTDDGTSLVFSSTAVSAQAASSLSGAGDFSSGPVALADGTLSYTWHRTADVTLHGAAAQLSAGGESALAIAGVSQFAEWAEASRIALSSTLRIVGDGEATGSAVRVDLQALSAFSGQSTLGDSQRSSQFELRVFECCSDVPVHWLSSSADTTSTSATLQQTFISHIGAELSFDLSLTTAPARLGLAMDVPGAGQGFSASDMLTATAQLAAVPEPAQALLWLVGLAGLGLGRGLWRQRSTPRNGA